MSDTERSLRKKITKALLIFSVSIPALLLVLTAIFFLWPRDVEPVDPVEARKWVNEHRRRLEREGRYKDDGSWKGPRVAIIGVDGLDFDEATKLMAQGRLPNLARIMKEGAAGKVRTLVPTLSPRIWTSVVTGVLPRNHGITNFIEKDAKTGRVAIQDSSYRRFPALWQMASDKKLTALL